jgi:hypothetical protein
MHRSTLRVVAAAPASSAAPALAEDLGTAELGAGGRIDLDGGDWAGAHPVPWSRRSDASGSWYE